MSSKDDRDDLTAGVVNDARRRAQGLQLAQTIELPYAPYALGMAQTLMGKTTMPVSRDDSRFARAYSRTQHTKLTAHDLL